MTVRVRFIDEDSNAVTPDVATYRIDDHFSSGNILPVTIIDPLGTFVDLEITSEQNRCLTENKREVRVITVEFDYGDGKHATSEYRYQIKNLPFAAIPSESLSPSASASPSPGP